MKLIPVAAMRSAMRRASTQTLMRTVVNSARRIRAGLTGVARQNELNRITAVNDEFNIRKFTKKSGGLKVRGRPAPIAKKRRTKKRVQVERILNTGLSDTKKLVLGLLLVALLTTVYKT